MVKVSKYLLLDGLRMGCKLADAKQKGCVNNGFEREVAGEGYLMGLGLEVQSSGLWGFRVLSFAAIEYQCQEMETESC